MKTKILFDMETLCTTSDPLEVDFVVNANGIFCFENCASDTLDENVALSLMGLDFKPLNQLPKIELAPSAKTLKNILEYSRMKVC